MGTIAEAKLFYGYLQPEPDRERYFEFIAYNDYASETPWTAATHTKRAHGCIGDIYGYSKNLGAFLAIEESLQKAVWDTALRLPQEAFMVNPAWDEQLWQAAATFGLDVTGMEPGWHLTCLYL